MIKENKLDSTLKQCLRDQTITALEPGPVLHDFQMLMDFLRPDGVEAGGKYNLLPIKFIGELDLRLNRPLRLEMKRPQLRSHPYLQGLHLLLRASGLSRVEGIGSRARLVLDPMMLLQWGQLNPTEQYFNLLEAWLRLGRAEMVGETAMTGERLYLPCLHAWQFMAAGGDRFNTRKPQETYLAGIGGSFYLLALMDLFGLVEVVQPPRPVKPWSPAGVNRLPFGDAVFSLLRSRIGIGLMDDFLGEQAKDQENADRGESPEELPRLGAWQPLFQPYFPEWRQNLEFSPLEPREGTFVFRVSLGEAWRLIAMPADATLHDLIKLILHSVEFNYDHLYAFYYRDRLGTNATANHPFMREGPWADQIRIGTLPLEPGQSIELTYDFGDCWQFEIKLARVEPPPAKAARILQGHGKSPRQYPRWGEN